MPIPAGIVKEGVVTTKKPEVVDQLFRVQDDDTIVFDKMNARSRNVKNNVFNWYTDEIRPGAANSKLEGQDYDATTEAQPVKLENRTQIVGDALGVTGTTAALDLYGMKAERMRQLMNKRTALKWDCEYILTHAQAPRADNGTLGAQTRVPSGWIVTNVNQGATGTVGTTSAAMVPGTDRALTETMLLDILHENAASGGFAKDVFVGMDIKKKIDTFTFGAVRERNAESNTVSQNVEIIKMANGVYKIHTNYKQDPKVIFGFDFNYWRLCYLRNWTTEKLAKTGDADREFMLAEFGVESSNEKASFMLTAVTA